MAKKRKPTVHSLYDRRYRNDPESRDLTAEEVTLFEAARQAIGLLKKTFETWTVIGKAVVAARARADRQGGGKTFRRILEQQGLARVVPPATATRLLAINERFAEVSAWHNSLTDQRQIAWASPSAVFKHCPAFAKNKSAAAKPRPGPKMHIESAIDAVVDHLSTLDVDNRLAVIERILSPFNLKITAKTKAPAPKRDVAAILNWKAVETTSGRECWVNYEAQVKGGTYEVRKSSEKASRYWASFDEKAKRTAMAVSGLGMVFRDPRAIESDGTKEGGMRACEKDAGGVR